jgi:hypothetical protein
LERKVKKIMEEVGVELESTEEIEDSEEFVVLDNESKGLKKVLKKKKEMKKILIEKAEEQSEKDWTVVGKIDDSNSNSSSGKSVVDKLGFSTDADFERF